MQCVHMPDAYATLANQPWWAHHTVETLLCSVLESCSKHAKQDKVIAQSRTKYRAGKGGGVVGQAQANAIMESWQTCVNSSRLQLAASALVPELLGEEGQHASQTLPSPGGCCLLCMLQILQQQAL